MACARAKQSAVHAEATCCRCSRRGADGGREHALARAVVKVAKRSRHAFGVSAYRERFLAAGVNDGMRQLGWWRVGR